MRRRKRKFERALRAKQLRVRQARREQLKSRQVDAAEYGYFHIDARGGETSGVNIVADDGTDDEEGELFDDELAVVREDGAGRYKVLLQRRGDGDGSGPPSAASGTPRSSSSRASASAVDASATPDTDEKNVEASALHLMQSPPPIRAKPAPPPASALTPAMLQKKGVKIRNAEEKHVKSQIKRRAREGKVSDKTKAMMKRKQMKKKKQERRKKTGLSGK